jgi:beta-N-acetylhexosaminidase
MLAAVGLTTGGATAREGRALASRELTLSQQVGQLLLLRFAGTRVPAYVRATLRERRVAGVVLFRDNVRSPGQLRALTTILRREGGRPIVAVDQEGGAVRTVGWAPPAAGATEQVATGTVRASAQRSAQALRSLGVTVTLAPVADVPSVSDSAIASRSFSSNRGPAASPRPRSIFRASAQPG